MRGFEILDSGETLYIEECGSGPAVICIHGLGGGAYYFSGLADTLKDRWRVISVDLPGAGFSPIGSEPFCFDHCADMLVEIAEKRAGGPFVLIAHSLGTIVALKAANLAPDFTQKIISIGGLPEALPQAKIRLRERAATIRKNGMMGLGDSILPLALGESALRAMPDKVFMLRRLLEQSPPEGYAQMAAALAEVSAHSEALRLQSKLLAITGELDHYAPPHAVDAFLNIVPNPGKHRVLPGVGHMPFFEAPEIFRATVIELLET